VAGSVTALTATPAAAGPGCQPGDITVTNTSDGAGPPPQSLRAAFAAATAASGPQRICVDASLAGQTINLTVGGGGELVYNATMTPGLTVEGNGITVHAAPNARVIDNQTAGPLHLADLTITGGNASSAGGGVVTSGDATLANVSLVGNTSTDRGGGITVLGDVTVINSTISANTAGFDGGGICVFGNAMITSSTLAGNTAGGGGDGGGVCAFGTMTVTNSTVVGNVATGDGGGLDTNGGLALVYSTVVQNTSGTAANLGLPGFGLANFTSFGSVVAEPLGGGGNCELAGTSKGFNFTDDASCGFPASETHAGVDPALGPVAANGGPTPTRLPRPGSPLIDAIPIASCRADGAASVTTDQRGVTRPQGPGCDIGAVEVQPAPSPIVVVPRFTG
jgi:hypothetical protein